MKMSQVAFEIEDRPWLTPFRSPLSVSAATVTSPMESVLPPAVSRVQDKSTPSTPRSMTPRSVAVPATEQPPFSDIDLSFLLDKSIYHPLSQLEIPLALRQSFPSLPSSNAPLSDQLLRLQGLLQTGNFLAAAYLAAAILVSGAVSPTDSKTIFDLLALRYSCLELTGNTLLAAQESKALEDLNSAFYYAELPIREAEENAHRDEKPPQQHIMPFPLRLQALRLQSIGFSDARRGVSSLYELGLECREHIASALTTEEGRHLWSRRLEEIGIRVVNALIDMGDLECASRTLASLKPVRCDRDPDWRMRVVLLYLKIGDVNSARKVLEESGEGSGLAERLKPLLSFAEGQYEEAAQDWEKNLQSKSSSLATLSIEQNMAVAYLYAGQVDKARMVLEKLLDDGGSSRGLVFNLATLYELISDKSRDLKLGLASRLARMEGTEDQRWIKSNVDFKL